MTLSRKAAAAAPLLAGVDIGTLTCRLLVARVGSGRLLERVKADRRILRLGEGVQQAKTLHPDAMERVIQTLREWRALLDHLRPDAESAVATSAVRDACNRAQFLERVQQETGFRVEVLSGEEEARRTLLGIGAGLPERIESFLGLDIGGGSTEFIVQKRHQPPEVQSVDIGVVRLTELALRSDPLTPAEVERARGIVRDQMVTVRQSLGDLAGMTLVGTAGSVTSLAAMALRLTTYEPARVHNCRLTLETVRGFETEFLRRTKAERRGLYGLEAGREDVIVAGTVILRAIMEELGYQECLVSDYGLREGVLIDLAMKQGFR